MAYATNDERYELIQSNTSFNPCPFVVRFKTKMGESEIACDDFEHAFDTAQSWREKGASYVEMFRVNPCDGSLYGGIGNFV